MARKGNADALRVLTNPHVYPVALRYLHAWAGELVGRSEREDGMLTWPTFAAWARQTGRVVTDAEMAGVFAVVAVMLHPGKADA